VLGWMTLVVAIGSLWVAIITVRRADRNASASTVITLNQSFADGWRRFQDAADDDRRDFEFAELMNTFEIAAGVHQDGALQGHAKKLVESYLVSALKIIDANQDARRRVGELRDTADTFEFLIRFRKAMADKMNGVTLLPNMQIAE
jgi:hypothetical protein